MKKLFFATVLGLSVSASAFVNVKATPKEVIDAVIEAQRKSNLECTVVGRDRKYKLTELDLAVVMDQVSKPIAKVDEASIPQIIINGMQGKDGIEITIEVVTTPDFKDIQKMKLERYSWLIKQINIGTITKPRYEKVKTKTYIENINCQ